MNERFDVKQYEDGQIYVTEDGLQMLHARISGQHESTIQIPSVGKVAIEKLYGPMVFMDIRVSCSLGTCEWVIERLVSDGTWREWCRIPGQLDEDFTDPPEET